MEHLNASSSKNFTRKFIKDMLKKYHTTGNAMTNYYLTNYFYIFEQQGLDIFL